MMVLRLPNSVFCVAVVLSGQDRREKKSHCISDPGIVNWAVGGSEIKPGHPLSRVEIANRSSSFAVEVCWEEAPQRGLGTSLICS